MTDYEFLVRSPEKLYTDLQVNGGFNFPWSLGALQKRKNLDHDDRIKRVDKRGSWSSVTIEILPGVTKTFNYINSATRGFGYYYISDFRVFSEKLSAEKSLLRYDVSILSLFPNNVTSKTSIKTIAKRLQGFYSQISLDLMFVADLFRTGQVFSDYQRLSGKKLYLGSFTFQGMVNLAVILRRNGFLVTSENLVKVYVRLREEAYHGGDDWINLLYFQVFSDGRLGLDLILDRDVIEDWLKFDQRNTFLGNLDMALREYTLATEGLRIHLSEKYGIPENLINERYFKNDKLIVKDKLKEELRKL